MGSLKLRLYAHSLGIDSKRRDHLLSQVDQWVRTINIIETIAQNIVTTAASGEEGQFLCHAVDSAFGKLHSYSFKARASIYTALKMRCASIYEENKAEAVKRELREVIERFSSLVAATSHCRIFDESLLPYSREKIQRAFYMVFETHKKTYQQDATYAQNPEIHEYIESLRVIWEQLAFFRKIDPRDRNLVLLANTLSDISAMPEAVIRVIEKYTKPIPRPAV
jgi:hypothetical protein